MQAFIIINKSLVYVTNSFSFTWTYILVSALLCTCSFILFCVLLATIFIVFTSCGISVSSLMVLFIAFTPNLVLYYRNNNTSPLLTGTYFLWHIHFIHSTFMRNDEHGGNQQFPFEQFLVIVQTIFSVLPDHLTSKPILAVDSNRLLGSLPITLIDDSWCLSTI